MKIKKSQKCNLFQLIDTILTKSWQKTKKKDRKGKTSKEEDLDQKIDKEKGKEKDRVLKIKREKDKGIDKEKKNTKNMTSMIVMIMTEEEIDDNFKIFNCFFRLLSKYKNL